MTGHHDAAPPTGGAAVPSPCAHRFDRHVDADGPFLSCRHCDTFLDYPEPGVTAGALSEAVAR